MPETKFRIVRSELVHLGLAKERFLKGLETEVWREKYPDHCAVLYDGQVLAFVSSLEQALFQIDEAANERRHEERICVFFIHDDPEHRKTRLAAEKSVTEDGFIDVETRISLIQEKLAGEDRDKVVAELNEVYSKEDWHKMLYEVVRTENKAFLEMIEGLPLNIEDEHLWIANKIVHDMEKAFPEPQI